MKQKVKAALDQYLELRRMKKTPERYAVLSAVYDFDRPITLADLDRRLAECYIKVSKATLYSALKLFIQARLVVKHSFPDGIFYEAEKGGRNYCHQVCSVCGKTTEISSPEINAAINNAKLKRFRKDGYSLYIYGVCTTCQARLSRQLNSEKKKKEKFK